MNQPPVDRPGAFQIAVQTLGRLADPAEFSNIVVKQTPNAVVRIKDVAQVELAADLLAHQGGGMAPTLVVGAPKVRSAATAGAADADLHASFRREAP